jgi:hypothetical protein
MTHLIKTLDDFDKTTFGYEKQPYGTEIFTEIDGKRKNIVIALGDKLQCLTVEPSKLDEVTVSTSAKSWEKEKLMLKTSRDEDDKLLRKIDNLGKQVFQAVHGSRLDRWYALLNTNSQLKAKVHPSQTLYIESGKDTEWRHLGSGVEVEAKTKKRKRSTPSPEKTSKKVKKAKPQDKGTIGGKDIMVEENHVKGVIFGSDLMESNSVGETQHYKIYEGDSICVQMELGAVWKMFVDGEHRAGITLKAKYISIFGRSETQSREGEEEEDEEELPPTDMF